LTLVIAIAAVALAAAAAGYLSEGGDSGPSQLRAADEPFVRGVVQSVSSDRLLLATESGTVEFRLGRDVLVEALRPAAVQALTIGDWVNGGAINHAQTLFALVGLVVIPPAQLEAPR
jgi:hypothetical protein